MQPKLEKSLDFHRGESADVRFLGVDDKSISWKEHIVLFHKYLAVAWKSSGLDYEIDSSIVDRTCHVLQGLEIVLKHHDCNQRVLSELLKTLGNYLCSCHKEDEWVSCCKYILTFPLARYLRNNEPVEPDYLHVYKFQLRGAARRWFKNRMLVFKPKNTHLWYSWLQAKRAAMPASESMVSLAYEKHFSLLSHRRDEDVSLIHEIMALPEFNSLLMSIAGNLSEAYHDGRLDSSLHSPSQNACFEKTRAEGGAKEYLRTSIGLPPRDSLLLRSTVDELVHMDYCARAASGERNIVYEIRAPFGGDIWGFDRNDHPAKKLKCTIQGVLEPLKVRIISKGEAIPYYIAKPLQVEIWNALRKRSRAFLIDRPISSFDVADIRLCYNRDRPDWGWCSIDYSAATDNSSSLFGELIFRKILSQLPDRYVDHMYRVLGMHDLYYPSRGGPVLKGSQERGQLMGSILSFNILCLMNMGIYLFVNYLRVLHSGSIDVEDPLRHVLVNGDDMLYVGTKEDFSAHITYGAKVGLDMSPGKAYWHRHYANMNSVSFVGSTWCPAPLVIELAENYSVEIPYDCQGYKPLRRVDFLNVGLHLGRHKVQERVCNPKGYIAVIPELLNGCLPGRQKRMLSEYLDLHSSDISGETNATYVKGTCRRSFHRNLFIPISLGGFGIEPPLNFKFKVTRTQRQLAALKLTLPDFYVKQVHPYHREWPGVPVRDVICSPDSNWGYRSRDSGDRSQVFVDNGNELKLLCRDLLFPYEFRSSCSSVVNILY